MSERGEGLEALGAEGGEVLEQGFDGLVGDEALEVETVEGLEGGVGVACEDHAHAGEPVGFVGEHQVAEDVDGAEGSWGFAAVEPGRGFAAKESVEDGGRCGEDFDGLVELELHARARDQPARQNSATVNPLNKTRRPLNRRAG